MRRWALIVVVVAAWEVATALAGSPFFPRPSVIAVRMHQQWLSGDGAALRDIAPTLVRVFAGLALAAVTGILLGVVIGLSARVHDYLDGVLQFLRTIPPPAVVTVFVVVFGFGLRMQLAFIVFSVVWPILLNTADGVRSVEPLYLDTGRVFKLSKAELLTRVVLPAALPKVFAGLRLALSLALIVTVFAELLPGTRDGIGFHLTESYARFDLPGMWAGLTLLGLFGAAFNELFVLAERRVLGRRI
ncbi:ABC transporter permease [Nonomuraea endophytica]|uniref:ABC transporter permease n=1 Tax=Nonomuraea endophytica TaxID=714136 RepID=UPI0037C6D554